MADMRVTFYERRPESGSLYEVKSEEFDANTSPRAAQLALEAAERWISVDRRGRS